MNDLKDQIYDTIIDPLETAIDGKKTAIRLNCYEEYSIRRWYETRGIAYQPQLFMRQDIEPVESIVERLRKSGSAEILSKCLTPLYVDFFTNLEFFKDRSEGLYMGRDEKIQKEEDLWTCYGSACLVSILKKEEYFEDLFDEIDLISLLERCLEAENNGFEVKDIFKHCVVEAVLHDYPFDWDDLYKKVKTEIKCAPSNCTKAKMEYCCIVIAVVMIMRNKNISQIKQKLLIKQLESYSLSSMLFSFYSVITKRVLGSRFPNINAVVAHFVTQHTQYAHLMISCLNFMQGRFEPNMQRKLDGQMAKLKDAMKTEQNDDMDELFIILFPQSEIVDYSCDSPQLTSGERMRQLAEAKKYNEELVKQLNSLTIENQQLRALSRMAEDAVNKGISIEALCDMFNGISDYETCRQMFMQMDYFIHKDEAWKENYDKLRDIVESKRVNMLDVLTKAAENKSGNGKVYVNGDYVMEKHVGHEVNGVASGGVGVRVEACN